MGVISGYDKIFTVVNECIRLTIVFGNFDSKTLFQIFALN